MFFLSLGFFTIQGFATFVYRAGSERAIILMLLKKVFAFTENETKVKVG